MTRVRSENADLRSQIEALNSVNAQLMAKNEKFRADKKAALEREKLQFAPESDAPVAAPAKTEEEIAAELAALDADEEEMEEAKKQASDAQDMLAAS